MYGSGDSVESSDEQVPDELQARFGADVAAWRWDHAHIARSEHRPFSHVKLLARFFELRTPVGGDTTTVNVSRVGLKPDAVTGELYLDEHGPSLRALYDLPSSAKFYQNFNFGIDYKRVTISRFSSSVPSSDRRRTWRRPSCTTATTACACGRNPRQ
jgi:hypothetical protein